MRFRYPGTAGSGRGTTDQGSAVCRKGYLTGWTYGTTQKYRVAFFNATGGNTNTRSFEQITYHGSNGDVSQRGYSWIDAGASLKGRGCGFGVVLAALAQECLSDGLNETPVSNGKVKTAQLTYYAQKKTTFINALSYSAALACKAAMEQGTVTYPYKYVDPVTNEFFLIGNRFQPGNITSSWNATLNAPVTTPVKLDMGAIVLGQDVAFVSMPGEPFDYYYNDTTLTGEDRSAPENNLWNELVGESTYGKPFVLGYCNGAVGYLVNYDGYTYNLGSEKWVSGCYEAQTSPVEQGTGETMLRIYDQMLTTMTANGSTSYTASCAHCGENQVWEPYSGQTTLTTGHYYLLADSQNTQIKIAGGQTVCIDLKGYTFTGESRAMYTTDSTRDVLNIMDSSEAQTGIIQGCGGTYGGGSGFGGGTILVAEGDEMNLYSGTLTSYDKVGYSTSSGDVLRIKGTFNMYGGKVTGGTASSFTGSYLSGSTLKTATKTGSGGNCVYVTAGCPVTLSDNAKVDQITFAAGSADTLTVDGGFTGKVTLEYPHVSLGEGTVIGVVAPAGDLSGATLNVEGYPCQSATAEGAVQ